MICAVRVLYVHHLPLSSLDVRGVVHTRALITWPQIIRSIAFVFTAQPCSGVIQLEVPEPSRG